MRSFRITLAMFSCLAAAGCHTMTPPADFVSPEGTDRGTYVMHSISADGVVVGLRTQDNPKQGTAGFWATAISSELTSRGYKLVKSEDVQNSAGTSGKLLEFTTQQQGGSFTYLLALYVSSGQVVLAEAGGKADAFSGHAADIRKSLLTAR